MPFGKLEEEQLGLFLLDLFCESLQVSSWEEVEHIIIRFNNKI